jgi:DNA-binding MarR family transcriptional regulator
MPAIARGEPRRTPPAKKRHTARAGKQTAGKRRAALFDAPDWADAVAIGAIRLGDALLTGMTRLLTEFGITPLQYNVLRILYVRDAEGEGLSVGAIGSALVTVAPDVSRLIDRLEKLGYLERVRKADDRRVVRVRLTGKGFELVERIHTPLIAHHRALFARISKSDLERIAGELGKLVEEISNR